MVVGGHRARGWVGVGWASAGPELLPGPDSCGVGGFLFLFFLSHTSRDMELGLNVTCPLPGRWTPLSWRSFLELLPVPQVNLFRKRVGILLFQAFLHHSAGDGLSHA